MSSRDETAKLAMLEKKRKEMLDSFAAQKNEIQAENAKNRTGSDRFVTKTDGVEDSLKRSTYGLVHLADFKETREKIEEEARRKAVQGEADKAAAKPKKLKKKKKEGKVKLSFAMDDDEEGDSSDFVKSNPTSKANTPANASDDNDNDNDNDTAEPPAKRAKVGKDPTIATSFLPDRERESAERAMREELRREWLKKQEDMKDEDVEITCSYWDGSGHRTSITCKKGDTIAQFLNKCRMQFAQLRNVSVDNLMYIKEDLIIPQHYTFYDFIVNKYRGKSGPMFNFDVHDDVRMVADATVEKDESHAGKIVERSWYNRSKHIFPASRWEVFNPDIVRDKYTIHGQ